MLTTSSGKHIKYKDHAHIVSLLYKLLASSRRNDDLSSGFGKDHKRRQRELTDNKNVNGKYHMRNYLKDLFGFAEHQEKATSGLGYKLTLTTNSDNAVSNKKAIAIGKIKINDIEWYLPHYRASLEQQTLLSRQIEN